MHRHRKQCYGYQEFPGGSVENNPPANARDAKDASLILGSGRSP